jgi:chromosomal replication initiator protein DnaA
MGKYSDNVVEGLLEHLDALDVLELIDYHPESMQRVGQIVKCWCPLCQDHSGRYLTVDLDTKRFISEPPDIPRQTGTLIDLYARVRRIEFDAAVEQLADEFGFHLAGVAGEIGAEDLLAEARTLIKAAADAEGEERDHAIEEAAKRLRSLLVINPDDLEANRELLRLRRLENNPFTLAPQLNTVIDLEIRAGDAEHLAEAVEPQLEATPNDVALRVRYAAGLVQLGARERAIAEYMTLADMAEQAGNPDAALRAYRAVQKMGDDVVDVHPMIVNLLVATGRTREAQQEIDARVEALKKRGRYEEASAEAVRLVDIMPGEAGTTALRVIELAIMGGLGEDAVARCLAMVDLLLDRGQVRQAAEALSYISAEQPENLMVLEMLVATYDQLGEQETAREFRHRLAEGYRAADRLEDAVTLLEQLSAENPEDARTVSLLGAIELQAGDTEAGLLHLEQALDLRLREGDREAAIALAEDILAADANRHLVRKRLINLLIDAGQVGRSVDEIERLSQILSAAGDNERLISILESLRERLPDNGAIKVSLATAYERLGDTARSQQLRLDMLRDSSQTAEVEETATHLLRRNPNDPTVLHLVARKYERDGDLAKARETYERLVTIHREAERLQEARAALDRVAAMFPEDLEVLGRLSDMSAELGDELGVVRIARAQLAIHRKAGNHEGVLEQARQVLEFQPDSEEMLRLLVSTLEAMGRREEAGVERTRLLELLRRRGEWDRVIELLEEQVAARPKEASLREELLGAMAQSGDARLEARLAEALDGQPADKAITLLRRLRAAAPNNMLVWRQLAAWLRRADRKADYRRELEAIAAAAEKEGDTGLALDVAREMADAHPQDVDLRLGLATRLRTAGRIPEAVDAMLAASWQLQKERKLREAARLLEEAATLAPGNPDVYTAHSVLLRDMGQDDQAAIKLCELATLLEQQGDALRAVATLHEVLGFAPRHTEARRQLIRLRLGRGDDAAALADLRELLALLEADGDTQGALDAIREARKARPEDVAISELLIRALRRAGREAEALREEVALAKILAANDRADEALAILGRIIEQDSENLAARTARAAVYTRLGRTDEAAADQREVEAGLQRMGGPAVAALTPPPVAAVAAKAPPTDSADGDLQLLPEYQFSTFVVGRRNSFAFATAKAVADNLGSERNPLFLYSDVGLGKTHLMHAIAHHARAARPGIRIHYALAVYFTTELEEAIRHDIVAQFRDRYKGADLLLLDDVQFLAGKEASQEEFFHLFNILYQRRSQIVLTSDRPPKMIMQLDKRLRSRFGQGVIVEIQPPDTDTRIAILKAEAKRLAIKVPEDVIDEIAETVDSNVRDLKGAFNQVISHHQIGGEPLTVKLARDVVSKHYSP